MLAGVHIAPTDDLKPSFSSESCKKTSTGDLAISGTTDANFSCAIKGKSLGKIVSMVLRNAKEPLDAVVAKGTITPASGDPTQATVSFAVTDLKALIGTDYDTMWVDANKIENSTGFVEQIPQPALASKDAVAPSKLALASLKSGKLTFTGTNLDMASGVQLESADLKTKVDLTLGTKTPTSIEATFSSDVIAKLTPGTYSLTLLEAKREVKNATALTLVISKN